MKTAFAGVALGLLSAVVAVATPSAQAQTFPSKPITIIVPVPPGGPGDILMRAMGEITAKDLGQPVVVENKPGATGTLGPATMAATARPDGHTVALMLTSVHRLPLQQDTPYDAEKDFTYIINLAGFAFVTITAADAPFNSWGDVVAYAKQSPGKVSYASTGVGGSVHLGMERLAGMDGIKLTHVPFRGSTEIQTAVAGGHVTLGVETAGVKSLVDAGKVKVLAVWTEKRVPLFPNAPTLTELGRPISIASGFGLAGPKGMKPAVVKTLHDAFLKAFKSPEIVEMLARYGMINEYKDSAAYRAWISEQIAIEKKLLAEIGLLKK